MARRWRISMDHDAGISIDTDPGGVEKAMWMEVMMEFKCKALLGCDDRWEKAFIHTAWCKPWRFSQLDYDLGHTNFVYTTILRRRMAGPSNKEDTWLGRMHTGHRGRQGKVQDEGDRGSSDSRRKNSRRVRNRLLWRRRQSTCPQGQGTERRK